MIRQFSSNKMTVLVVTRRGIITKTAPITRKFIGQPVNNLRGWMSRQGGFREFNLKIGRPSI